MSRSINNLCQHKPSPWYGWVIFLWAMVLCLAGCDGDTKRDEIAKKNLVLATSADNPPFEFFRFIGDKEKITGFDIDVADAIAQVLEVDLEIQDMPFNAVIPALISGRADIAMAAIAPTPERERAVDFSQSYISTQMAVIAKPGQTIQKYRDLSGMTVGVQLGSAYEKDLSERQKDIPDLKVISLASLGELVQELRSRRIHGVLTEESVARAYVGSNRDIESYPLEGTQAAFVIAFPKGSPLKEPFDRAIETLRQKGVLDELFQKWFQQK